MSNLFPFTPSTTRSVITLVLANSALLAVYTAVIAFVWGAVS